MGGIEWGEGIQVEQAFNGHSLRGREGKREQEEPITVGRCFTRGKTGKQTEIMFPLPQILKRNPITGGRVKGEKEE